MVFVSISSVVEWERPSEAQWESFMINHFFGLSLAATSRGYDQMSIGSSNFDNIVAAVLFLLGENQ